MTDDTKTTLDPEDWAAFRATAHRVLEACLDRMEGARDLPWQPLPADQAARYHLAEGPGRGEAAAAARMVDEVMPYATGNTHPRFFGWVHGTGLPVGLLSEMVSATMNANCGGRHHGMNEVERAVIDWTRRAMGLPEGTSGVLVTGTSQATVIALAAARGRVLPDSRVAGLGGARLTVYAAEGVHNATTKAVELLGLGRSALRLVPAGEGGADIAALRDRIARDRAEGCLPMAIVGTAGSVDLGRFDDLNALADLAAETGLWLHVDGAFGAWTRLAEAPWHGLTDGIGRADSLACDFHKWMYVPYDCGIVLIRNEAEHRAAFAARPAYLAAQEAGLGGGEPWFCDYGVDLSRGGRALRVWAAIEAYGAGRLGRAITANCRAAARLAAAVAVTPRMALAAPVVSNVCAFTADAGLPAADQSRLNARLAEVLQLNGAAVLSTTTVDGRTVLRAAITNHRTTPEDIDLTVTALIAARATLEGAA